MKRYYECHITMENFVRSRALTEMDVQDVGWVFSAIDGDPILGEGVKTYATKHFRANGADNAEQEFIKGELERIANKLHHYGNHVMRKKIELVVYDAISGRDFQ